MATAGRVADRANRVIDPAQREITVGKILAPGHGIEPPLAFVGARQGQILLQCGDPLNLIVTGLVYPVHDLSMRSSSAAAGRGEHRGPSPSSGGGTGEAFASP